MMAMLFATKIILGKITYSDVPTKLKDPVKEILIENGLEDLAVETVTETA
ncbi:MAG: CD1375 family protein [Lachnospiraceae bacterium]|nr:CD1375 family protein [Lachnospiraceae bacterium]